MKNMQQPLPGVFTKASSNKIIQADQLKKIK